MKVLDYLMELPFGEVVNKRALSVFKRLGILDYCSIYGYLEGDGRGWLHFEYKGIWFRSEYFSGCFKPYLVKVEPPKKYDANGRLVPKKQLYYRGYKCAFKQNGYHDNIYELAMTKFRTLRLSYSSHAFDYACHKSCTNGTRYRVANKANVRHRMCLLGAVI